MRVVKKKIRLILDDVVERLVREYQPEQAILYGSYAYGTPNEESDIDIFIVKETNGRPVDRIVEVMRLLFIPGRDVSIEPLVYTPGEISERLNMHDPFLSEILVKGRVIYKRVG